MSQQPKELLVQATATIVTARQVNETVSSTNRAMIEHTLVSMARHRRLSNAWVLPTFKRTPAAVGLNGSPITADNIILSDCATVYGQRR